MYIYICGFVSTHFKLLIVFDKLFHIILKLRYKIYQKKVAFTVNGTSLLVFYTI